MNALILAAMIALGANGAASPGPVALVSSPQGVQTVPVTGGPVWTGSNGVVTVAIDTTSLTATVQGFGARQTYRCDGIMNNAWHWHSRYAAHGPDHTHTFPRPTAYVILCR